MASFMCNISSLRLRRRLGVVAACVRRVVKRLLIGKYRSVGGFLGCLGYFGQFGRHHRRMAFAGIIGRALGRTIEHAIKQRSLLLLLRIGLGKWQCCSRCLGK